MKKIILAIIAFVITTASFAQPKPGKHHGFRGPGMEMSKLNLSETQQQQMKTESENFRTQMQELNKKEDITVKEQRDQRATIAKAHKQKVESLLTAEQKNQLAQMKAERKQKMEAMAARRMDKLKEKLALTDAQVATLKTSREQAKSKIEAILKDDNMGGSEKREYLMTMKDEMKNEMDKVLTPEQKIKMETIRKEQHQKMKSFIDRRGDRMDKEEVK